MSDATGFLNPYDGARGRVWYAMIRLPDGTRKQIRIGKDWTGKGRPPTGYFTEKTAERELQRLLVAADNGDISKPSGLTLGRLADEWLDYVANDRQRKHSTVQSYRLVVDTDFKPRWGDWPAEKVDEKVVDAYRRELVDKGKSASTINKRLIFISGIFKLARRRHGLKSDPAELVERQPSKPSGHIDVLSPSEVIQLADKTGGWFGRLIKVAAFTGMRMSELRQLRWQDVDFKKKLIHVRHAYVLGVEDVPKSNRVRSVLMVDQARDALKEQQANSSLTRPGDLVFPNEAGNQFDDGKARKLFTKACKDAKVRKLRFHDLRHTFGTMAVEVFPISTVQHYMGHAQISTTMVYVHHKSREDDADLLAQYINNQTKEAS